MFVFVCVCMYVCVLTEPFLCFLLEYYFQLAVYENISLWKIPI